MYLDRPAVSLASLFVSGACFLVAWETKRHSEVSSAEVPSSLLVEDDVCLLQDKLRVQRTSEVGSSVDRHRGARVTDHTALKGSENKRFSGFGLVLANESRGSKAFAASQSEATVTRAALDSTVPAPAPAPAPPAESSLLPEIQEWLEALADATIQGIDSWSFTDPPQKPRPQDGRLLIEPLSEEEAAKVLEKAAQIASTFGHVPRNPILMFPGGLDCKVAEWTEWSDCVLYQDDTYRSRFTVRTRPIIEPQVRPGKSCPGLVQASACNERGLIYNLVHA